jgi:hypothetical protein
MGYVLFERLRRLPIGTSLKRHSDEGTCIYRVTLAACHEGVIPVMWKRIEINDQRLHHANAQGAVTSHVTQCIRLDITRCLKYGVRHLHEASGVEEYYFLGYDAVYCVGFTDALENPAASVLMVPSSVRQMAIAGYVKTSVDFFHIVWRHVQYDSFPPRPFQFISSSPVEHSCWISWGIECVVK